MMPYIGVSELSCAFCDLFFAAYREHKGAVYTHGTHGQMAPWKYPILETNAEIKTTFCQKMIEYIKARLADEKWRRKASVYSQSTVSSMDGSSESMYTLHVPTTPNYQDR